MKTILLSALVAGMLVACGSPETRTAVAQSGADSTTPPPLPVGSGVQEVVAYPNPQASPSASPGVSSTVSEDNLKRRFQLRELQRVSVKVGEHTLKLWVMDTDAKRAEGMMWLTEKEVKDDEGMIFVFPEPQPLSFWMQNTLLGLDIIYLTPQGCVLNIVEGKPLREDPLPSKGNAQYVIELKVGMSKKFGIKEGMTLTLPRNLKARD